MMEAEARISIPWADDRAIDERAVPLPSPRSARDLEILRSLARRINPGDPGAHNNLGVVYYNKGLIEDAVNHFERALELDPRMQVAERNLQIAYFATGFYEDVVNRLREQLAREPENLAARERLARAYLYGGDPAGAVRELQVLVAARPNDPTVYQRLSRAYQQRGDLENALPTAKRAVELADSNARAHLLLGELLYQLGRGAEAREPLERAVAVQPELAEAHHLLAFVYGDLGDMQRAEKSAARAAELNPTLGRAEANLSLDAYSTARYRELIGERSARPDVEASGTLAHYNLGLAFRQNAQYEDALREFRLATERGEDSMLVQQAEGEMLLLRGDSVEAAKLYEELVRQEPKSPKLWNELGVALHQQGDPEAAEDAYRKSLEVDPTYTLAWNNYAVALQQQGDAEEAERAFRQALGQGRALSDIWRNLGLLRSRSGRREEALDAYRQSLVSEPESAVAWTGLGVVLMELARAADARAALLRAVEADPKMAEARYHLAFALSALGDYHGALRETRLALELDPYIPQPRFRLLIDLQFEEASVLAPELDVSERVRAGFGEIRKFDFKPEALDQAFAGTLPAAVTSEADAPAGTVDGKTAAEWLEEAQRGVSQGQLERATEDAQRAARAGADRREILLLQGDIYAHRGLAGEAVERYNAVLSELESLSPAELGSVETLVRRALQGAASCYLELERLSEAAESAQKLVTHTPGDIVALRLLARIMVKAEDYTRAVVVLEQARVAVPRDPGLLAELGSAHLGKGELPKAEIAFRQAIAIDDFAVSARTSLGRILQQTNRVNEAATEYRAALELIPSYADAAYGLAELESNRGRMREAVIALADLLSVDPYNLEALARLGDILHQGGRVADAITAYRRVLHFDPGHTRALDGLERAEPGSTGTLV